VWVLYPVVVGLRPQHLPKGESLGGATSRKALWAYLAPNAVPETATTRTLGMVTARFAKKKLDSKFKYCDKK